MTSKKNGRRTQYGDVINLYHPTEGPKPDAAIKVTPSGKQGCIVVLLWKKTYTKLKGMTAIQSMLKKSDKSGY